jgi:hypothetical protein
LSVLHISALASYKLMGKTQLPLKYYHQRS